MTQSMNDIEATLDQLGIPITPSEDIASVLAEPPPPPSGSTAPDLPSQKPPTKKEQTAAERAAEAETKARISPTLKSLGYIARLLPGAERIRISKRHERTGQLAWLCDLTTRDLEACGDLETYVHRYLVPSYGGGEYVPVAIDGKNNERFVASIHVLTPPAQTQTESNVSLMKEVLARLSQPPPPAPDPFEQMLRAQETMKRLKEMTGQKDNGMDPMMLMMLMQQMQPQRPAADPSLIALVEKLSTKIEALEKRSNDAPLALPPPPPADPTAQIAAVVSVLAPLMKPEKDPNAMGIADVLRLAKELQPPPAPPPPPEDRPSWRDVIQILQDKKAEEKPSNSLMEQVQAVAQTKQMMDQLFPQQVGPQGTTMWDAIINTVGPLFAQEQFGANLGKAIAARVGSGANQPPPPRQQLPPVQSRPVANLPAQTAPAPAQPPEPPAKPKIPLPESIRETCQVLEHAEEDGVRMEAVVRAMFALNKIQQWQPIISATLQNALANNKQEVMQNFLHPFLGLLIGESLLSREAAQKVMIAFDTKWEHVHSELQARLGAMTQQPAASQPPAPTAPEPPAEASDDPVEAQGDEHEEPTEEPEDDGPAMVDVPDEVLAEMSPTV